MQTKTSYKIRLYACRTFLTTTPIKATLCLGEKEIRIISKWVEREWVIPYTDFTRVRREFPFYVSCLQNEINVLSFSALGHTKDILRMLRQYREKTALEAHENYDLGLQHFSYRIPMTEGELLRTLALPNIYDELHYLFDEDARLITFEAFEHRLSYQMEITPRDGFCVLRLSQIDGCATRISTCINSFMRKKLHAEPLAYEKF